MQKIVVTFFLIIGLSSFAQKEKSSKMGQTTLEELQMNVYEKDSTANAVVLYEHGNTFLNPSSEFSYRKDYYVRIKILDKKAFDKAIIVRKYYNNDLIHYIEGITYNLIDGKIKRFKLEKKDIHISQFDKDTKQIAFTLPNISEQSVIEYKFSRSSNYYDVYDWLFQWDIPKKTSLMTAEISNWAKYNIKFNGFLKLDKEEVTAGNRCKIRFGGFNCLNLTYQINNIPAFVVEKHMSSLKNFTSKISFERDYSDKFTKKKDINTWKNLDKLLASIDNFGIPIKKERFFKKKLNPKFLTEKNSLTKAKNIYYWAQNYYTWNGKQRLFGKNDVKKAFKEKSGSNSVINFSLYNALKAAGINTQIAILSTRKNGYITKLHPAITEFNYLIVMATINGIDYFLDASNKFMKFGQTPFKTLNGNVRILDFKKGSYWKALTSNIPNKKNIQIGLTLEEGNIFKGDVIVTSNGYDASFKRAKATTQKNKDFIDELEIENINLEVFEYTKEYENNLEKPFVEKFKANIESEITSNETILINPFLVEKVLENPFKLKERLYPVNFGAPFSEAYIITLKVPSGYRIKNILKSKITKLPNNTGKITFRVSQKEQEITLFFNYRINKSLFLSPEYETLKAFYKEIITIQNTYIEIENIN